MVVLTFASWVASFFGSAVLRRSPAVDDEAAVWCATTLAIIHA
jgi:hypothetical protein